MSMMDILNDKHEGGLRETVGTVESDDEMYLP